MASTTIAKKEIADFLWEWAESHGDWAKLLIDKIVQTESNLTVADRQTIFQYFLQSIKLVTGLPAIKVTKPTYKPTDKEVQLISLSNVYGVNRLAKNQNLTFGKNITIVYGENGTGKTGYGRILKSLGFSYDTGSAIHPNLYGNRESKSASIAFSLNGTNQNFNWTGGNNNPDLSNISVFNSNCVQISLADRHLIVAPIGFHLFNLVTSELQELNKLLEAKITAYPVSLAWVETLSPGTPQQQFMASLSARSVEEKLKELATFDDTQQTALQNAETELSNLNKTLLQTEMQYRTAQSIELNNIISQIQSSKSIVSEANWQLVMSYNKDIFSLEGRAQTGLKEIAELNGISFYATTEFQSFITSAENYIKLLDNPGYPGDNDICVYCRQPLEDSAKLLLDSYRKLLNDKTQETLQSVKRKKSDLLNRISGVNTTFSFHQPTFGADGGQMPIQPKEIEDYNRELQTLKVELSSDQGPASLPFSFDYDKYINFFTRKKKEIDEIIGQKKLRLDSISATELTLKNRISELKDRKLLASKMEEIKKIIFNYKMVNHLRSNSTSFNTASISRKTSEARDELVKQNFNTIFQNELRAFRKSDINIQISFGTERGNSRVTQRIGSHTLTEILSEGEQKAIALAEFLTELQLDNVKAPVIFDDPVNSLDHRIIDEAAKRFIELSRQRQVIIFTHSILLLNSFIQQSELETNKSIAFTFHGVRNNFGETGILDSVEEINSFNYYIKKLTAVLTENPAGKDENKLAAEGYGHLRSAIEVSVEEDILKRIIKRYRKGVAFPSLLRIDGSKLDTHKGKLNDIYEKCCVSIAGHSSPAELHTTPTLSELKQDYASFVAIRGNFNK